MLPRRASWNLWSCPGNSRPLYENGNRLIAEALARLRARTCILDGEAVASGNDGIALFELVRHWRNGETAFLIAFDLIELNGEDLRAQPLERRKAILARLLSRSTEGIQLNERLEHSDGALVFEHACKSLPMSVGAGRLHSCLEMQAPDLASKGEGRFKAEAGTAPVPALAQPSGRVFPRTWQ